MRVDRSRNGAAWDMALETAQLVRCKFSLRLADRVSGSCAGAWTSASGLQWMDRDWYVGVGDLSDHRHLLRSPDARAPSEPDPIAHDAGERIGGRRVSVPTALRPSCTDDWPLGTWHFFMGWDG